jgi:hypothetical protein
VSPFVALLNFDGLVSAGQSVLLNPDEWAAPIAAGWFLAQPDGPAPDVSLGEPPANLEPDILQPRAVAERFGLTEERILPD